MIVSRVSELKAIKEREVGSRITAKDISDSTGLTQHTIGRWLRPDPIKRIESDVIIPLCEFFDCEIGDLVHIEYR